MAEAFLTNEMQTYLHIIIPTAPVNGIMTNDCIQYPVVPKCFAIGCC